MTDPDDDDPVPHVEHADAIIVACRHDWDDVSMGVRIAFAEDLTPTELGQLAGALVKLSVSAAAAARRKARAN
jgi:hypothetical protein